MCDQPVTQRPATIPAPHLEAVEAKLEKARSDDTAARKAAEERRDALAKAETMAKEAERAAGKSARPGDRDTDPQLCRACYLTSPAA